MGTTVIEQTGKAWKAIQLLGGLMAVVGFAVAVAVGTGRGSAAVLAVSILGGVMGLIAFIVGRIGAWWFHG
jgi:hypothetical protein